MQSTQEKITKAIAVFVVFGGASLAVWKATRRGSGSRLGGFEGRRESAIAMPHRWWEKTAPREDKVCYATKTDALNVFREYNWDVIQEYGGIEAKHRPSEFDAINAKHGLKGKYRADTIAKALWLAMPPERPYCLDQIDVDALNETAPGQSHPVGFMLPESTMEKLAQKAEADEWARYYESIN